MTADYISKIDLFSPIQVGPYGLKNRIAMAPMTRNRAGAGNVPQDINAEYYRQRASAGLIITEASQVSPQGQGYPATPGIHSAEQVTGWQKVTDAVHQQGGRIFLQLWHVGRISHPSLQPDGALPVAPSAIKPEGEAITYEGPQPFVTPPAPWKPRSSRTLFGSIPSVRKMPWLPVLMAWRYMLPKAICWINSCVTAATSVLTRMVVQ